MSESIVAKRTYSFALEVVKLYQYLSGDKKEYVLSKQVLRSGTSIGANVSEALAGQSKRDFIYKLNIALKEARETAYWLNLLRDSNYIQTDVFAKMDADCREIIKMLNSIILTTKQRYFSNEPIEEYITDQLLIDKQSAE